VVGLKNKLDIKLFDWEWLGRWSLSGSFIAFEGNAFVDGGFVEHVLHVYWQQVVGGCVSWSRLMRWGLEIGLWRWGISRGGRFHLTIIITGGRLHGGVHVGGGIVVVNLITTDIRVGGLEDI
jgi:hypothetical protein